MKLLFRGYNIERFEDEIITVYKPGMEVVDGVVYVANLEVEFDGSDFDEVATIVGKDSQNKSNDYSCIYFPDPSDENVRMIFHQYADIINPKSHSKEVD